VNPPPKEKSNLTISLVVMVVVAVVFAIVVSKMSKPTPEPSRDCSPLMDLKNIFPHQDPKLFKSLKFGVENALSENGSPMVLSLFSTDMGIINSFMQEVVRETQKCINQSQDPINLSSDKLNSKMVENYKDELTRRTIMVINNVEEAQGSDVASLHSFCDTYNPLVSKSIIFITIKVPASPPGKPVEYIHDFLNQQWESLPDYKRSPLIARMLDQTFFLKP
jgi:hypothetical protein